MELEITLNKEDYLNYQLYKASKMKSTKIKRIRNRIIASLLIFIVGILFYFQNDNKMIYIIVYGIMSLIIFIFYPLYQRILYKRHFSKFIDENYTDKIGEIGTMKLENDHIVLKNKDNLSESKLYIKEIENIVEIKTNYFIILGNSTSIILPKSNNVNVFIDLIKNNYNIKLDQELDWKWK